MSYCKHLLSSRRVLNSNISSIETSKKATSNFRQPTSTTRNLKSMIPLRSSECRPGATESSGRRTLTSSCNSLTQMTKLLSPTIALSSPNSKSSVPRSVKKRRPRQRKSTMKNSDSIASTTAKAIQILKTHLRNPKKESLLTWSKSWTVKARFLRLTIWFL